MIWHKEQLKILVIHEAYDFKNFLIYQYSWTTANG